MKKSMEILQKNKIKLKKIKIKIKLSYDPAILLVGICSKEMKSLSQRDIYTPLSTEVLFTITNTWKQPKCLLTDEWVKNIW